MVEDEEKMVEEEKVVVSSSDIISGLASELARFTIEDKMIKQPKEDLMAMSGHIAQDKSSVGALDDVIDVAYNLLETLIADLEAD